MARTHLRPRVLIVENAGAARDDLRALLETRGCQVEVAGDAATGVRKALAAQPGAVVVAADVAPLGGFPVVRALRAVLGPVPTVICRANPGRPIDVRRARSAGFDDVFEDDASADGLRQLLGLDSVPEAAGVGA